MIIPLLSMAVLTIHPATSSFNVIVRTKETLFIFFYLSLHHIYIYLWSHLSCIIIHRHTHKFTQNIGASSGRNSVMGHSLNSRERAPSVAKIRHGAPVVASLAVIRSAVVVLVKKWAA